MSIVKDGLAYTSSDTPKRTLAYTDDELLMLELELLRLDEFDDFDELEEVILHP